MVVDIDVIAKCYVGLSSQVIVLNTWGVVALATSREQALQLSNVLLAMLLT